MKIGPKGQVVIPKRIRDRLGLKPGDRVRVELDGDAVRVARTVTVDQLIGSVPATSPSPLDVLMEERQRDRHREARR
ncbi:MAG: AbrB/MazE/SpoVT family DNA-binding domain-containing protein [Solirubrobacterales bacterium]